MDIITSILLLTFSSHSLAWDEHDKPPNKREETKAGDQRAKFPKIIPKEGQGRGSATTASNNGTFTYNVFIPLDLFETTATCAHCVVEINGETHIYLSAYSYLSGTSNPGEYQGRSQICSINLKSPPKDEKIHLHWLLGNELKFQNSDDLRAKQIENIRLVKIEQKKGDLGEVENLIHLETELTGNGNRLGPIVHKIEPSKDGIDLFISAIEIETRKVPNRLTQKASTIQNVERFTIAVPAKSVQTLGQVHLHVLK